MATLLPSLLLLPPPPTLLNSESISAAYGPAITATVAALKVLEARSELVVLLSYPRIHHRLGAPRSCVYNEVQRLVGSVYSLLCLVCAKEGADVESDVPGSIDARIVVVDDVSKDTSLDESPSSNGLLVAGPILELASFAAARCRWNLIFSVDGEEGQNLLSRYSYLANQTSPPLLGQTKLVSGGVSMVQNDPQPEALSTSTVVHHVVAVGGTFDHVHAGHKLLLTATALLLQPTIETSPVSRRLVVGITGDVLLKNKKYAEYLKSWKQRQEDVVGFLLSILSFTRASPSEATSTISYDEGSPNGRAVHTTLNSCSMTIECVEIQDPFGPTITDESISALVVSGETRSGGQAINDKRSEKGFAALEIFEVDVLDAHDDGENSTQTGNFASKISSTAIRKRKAETAARSSL